MYNLERINDYLTSDEATQLLGCSKRTLRRYSSQGLVAKVGKGKGVRYSLESVLYLRDSKGSTKYDKILAQLSSVVSTQQLILTRLSLMEAAFYTGPKVALSSEDIDNIKKSIKEVLCLESIPFTTCEDWSKDLLKLSRASLDKLGLPLVRIFVDRLILNASSHITSEKKYNKRLVADRLRLVRSSVE